MKNKIDTTKGYVNKPKPVDGYSVERYYCECGCKSGYWHYVKLKNKKCLRHFYSTHHILNKP